MLETLIIEDEPTEPIVNDEDFYAANKAADTRQGRAKRRRIHGKTKVGQPQTSSQAASSALSAPGPAILSDGESSSSSSSSGSNDDNSDGSSDGSNDDKGNPDRQ